MKMRKCLIILFALVSGFPVDLRPAPSETTTTVRCFHKDRWYRPGENVSYGQTGNMCSWSFCNNYGQIVYVDNWNCNTIMDTTPFHIQTTPGDCLYEGKLYPRGTEIKSSKTENFCSLMICDESGKIVISDDFDCQTTSTSSHSCFANGQWYAPREEISHGHTENYCYRKFCDPSGQIIEERDWKCTTTMAPALTSYVNSTVGQ